MKTEVRMNPRIGPDPVAAEVRRIGSLIESNDLGHAEVEAQRLLGVYPQRPDVHTILGVAYIRHKKPQKAVAHFEFAAKAEPGNSHYLNNLGRLYIDLGIIELALPFLQKALAIDPNLTSALLAIGKYHNRVGKPELALSYFERLHRTNPQDNSAKLELAKSLASLGRKEEAGKLYSQLRETQSHAIAALYYFSRNDPPNQGAALVAEIEQLLLRDSLTDQQRSTLHTALGFIHEKNKNYPSAFSHFEKSSQLRSVPFDLAEYRAWVDGVISVFTADFFRNYSNIGNPSALPVLVVGMPRSGATLIQEIIASHGRGGGAGELTRIGLFARRLSYASLDTTKFIASLDALDRNSLREMADNYVDLLQFHAPGAERVVDMLPHNFENLGFASLLVPNARIIHCSRNPLDTCWSCFQNPLPDTHSYSKDLTHLGLYYREYKRLMDHWRAVLPLPIYELSYERLMTDFETEARNVIEFLGLPWDEACLKYSENGPGQIKSSVYGSVESWRHYEKELQPLVSALGDLA